MTFGGFFRISPMVQKKKSLDRPLIAKPAKGEKNRFLQAI